MKYVLFVCVHNSGRSQMAEAILNAEAARRRLPVRAASAGTMPADSINPAAEYALAEVGLSLQSHVPKLLTPEMVQRASRVIGMGCGLDADACPTGTYFTEDWGLEDPAGQPIEKVREIRDEITRRVRALLDELASAGDHTPSYGRAEESAT